MVDCDFDLLVKTIGVGPKICIWSFFFKLNFQIILINLRLTCFAGGDHTIAYPILQAVAER